MDFEAQELDSVRRVKDGKDKKDHESMDEENEDDMAIAEDDSLDEMLVDSDAEKDDKSKSKKRRVSFEDDEDDRLEDDDYELLAENWGIRVKKKFKRVKQLAEDSDDETGEKVTDKDAIAIDLFDGSDNEEDLRRMPKLHPEREFLTDESESETDDFIVDDNDMPLKMARQKRRSKSSNPYLKEAQDVFGIDFDYDEIRKINTGEAIVPHDEDDEDEESDEAASIFRKKEKKRKKNRKPIHEIYEPSEIQSMGLTEEEVQIKMNDIPERFQLRPVPIQRATDMELDEEAEWILDILETKNKKDPQSKKQLTKMFQAVSSSPKGCGWNKPDWDESDKKAGQVEESWDIPEEKTQNKVKEDSWDQPEEKKANKPNEYSWDDPVVESFKVDSWDVPDVAVKKNAEKPQEESWDEPEPAKKNAEKLQEDSWDESEPVKKNAEKSQDSWDEPEPAKKNVESPQKDSWHLDESVDNKPKVSAKKDDKSVKKDKPTNVHKMAEDEDSGVDEPMDEKPIISENEKPKIEPVPKQKANEVLDSESVVKESWIEPTLPLISIRNDILSESVVKDSYENTLPLINIRTDLLSESIVKESWSDSAPEKPPEDKPVEKEIDLWEEDIPIINLEDDDESKSKSDIGVANIQDPWDGEDTPKVDENAEPEITSEQRRIASRKMKLEKIRNVLECIKNLNLDIPFIFAYRKELIGSGDCKGLEQEIRDDEKGLLTEDLWDIYNLDGKFCQLKKRVEKLYMLFFHVKEYHDFLTKTDDKENDDETKSVFMKYTTQEMIDNSARVEIKQPDFRPITDEDLKMILNIKSTEELEDFNILFNINYSDFVEPVKLYLHKKTGEQFDEGLFWSKKMKAGFGPYAFCTRKLSLNSIVSKFGLSSAEYGENLKNGYQKNEVVQYNMGPMQIAETYISPYLSPTVETVLTSAVYVLGTRLSAEPLVRQTLREEFFNRATFSIRPTPKGRREIDETSPLFKVKYLTNKPVTLLKKDEFLKYVIAEENKLIVLTIGENLKGREKATFLEEMKDLFFRDEYYKDALEWNELRGRAVTEAYVKQLVPAFQKEMRTKLLREAKDFVLLRCRAQFVKCVSPAPYLPKEEDIRKDKVWDCSKGVRVVSVAYGLDPLSASFVCCLQPDGEPAAFLRLNHLLKSINSRIEEFRHGKKKDMKNVKRFIEAHKPHVIVIGGDSNEALKLRKDILAITEELMNEKGFPKIGVEIMDSDISRVIGNSNKFDEFKEFPALLKEAVSLGRRIQNPLLEIAQLASRDDELLCVKFHPMQEHVNSEELLDLFNGVMTDWVGGVGVNINDALRTPRIATLLNYVSGLGPRKARYILRTFQALNYKVENRALLITKAHMGPIVFVNCSGFIKIVLEGSEDSEIYNEPLDSTRIHPETYDWARKMAVDALEYDDDDDEIEPSRALDEILEDPGTLNDLDLDAFAAELQRQGFGSKRVTLQDIRYELIHRFKEVRAPYKSPTPQELFKIITKETPTSLYAGKLVRAYVVDLIYKKKKEGESLEDDPKRRSDTDWYCGNCFLSGFSGAPEIWEHFDKNECPGKAFAVRIKLENEMSGMILIHKLSDKEVQNPWDRVKIGQLIICRVKDVNLDNYMVCCESNSTSLLDIECKFKIDKDPYFDETAEKLDLELEKLGMEKKAKVSYVKRAITHPSFHNLSYEESERIMAVMDQGESIIRPSSKGPNNLTVSWKVTDKIIQHVNVKEMKKENAFSIGRSLWIEDEEYEDLDEIIARFVHPMAGFARELINYKYYQVLGKGERHLIENYLRSEQEKNLHKIHYVICPSWEYRGRFFLSYLPNRKIFHEYITLTLNGLRYRGRTFGSLVLLLDYFKIHYLEPPPNVRIGSAVEATPNSTMGATSVLSFGHRSPGGFSIRSAASDVTRLRRLPPTSVSMVAQRTPAAGQIPYDRKTPIIAITPGPTLAISAPSVFIQKTETGSVVGGIKRGQGHNPFNVLNLPNKELPRRKTPMYPNTPKMEPSKSEKEIVDEWD